ncbi:methionine synthase [Fodinicola feengrottensis]|uniref:Methionine synthase n=1 Tax=Fodinicola feengrottensis TaxID=435914 RepID=A0ABN2H8G6_9ACTN
MTYEQAWDEAAAVQAGTPTARWPVGAATGIGSMPGTDVVEATATVLGELPDFPHLPELPGRGAGADLIGRSTGILVELPVEVAVTAWRMASRPGRDTRRIADLLARDLDTLSEQADGYSGPLKIQVAGPWTLAGQVELRNGERVLTDHGATAELVASLAQGLADHVADLRRRVPGATIVTQLDEPTLPAVLEGSLRTASGYRTVPPVETTVVERDLRAVLTAAGGLTAIHCCAPDVPLALLRRTGVSAVAVDMSLLDLADSAEVDRIAEHIDSGVILMAGVLPGDGTDPSTLPAADVLADKLRKLVTSAGFGLERVPAALTVTPSCGLAGASADYAQAALKRCVEVGRALAAG